MGMSAVVADLVTAVPLVAPSLLACDFAHLGREIRALEEAGARLLHLDVMDGHFVPNLSIGVPVVEAVRRVTDLPLDVHLMVSNPGDFLEAFRRAGADLITVHVEAASEPGELLERIHQLGAGAGLALSPPTPVQAVGPHLDRCDLVLTMSVMPGFGGQEFDPVALAKLRWLAERARPETLLSVDGGVNDQTIGPCAEAGAKLFVIGTALLNHGDYRRRMAQFRELLKPHRNVQVQNS